YTVHSVLTTGCSMRRIHPICMARAAAHADLYSSAMERSSRRWRKKAWCASDERLDLHDEAIVCGLLCPDFTYDGRVWCIGQTIPAARFVRRRAQTIYSIYGRGTFTGLFRIGVRIRPAHRCPAARNPSF